ncbi:DUF6092 family protein [Streptomyces catenulae]|uniref:DUF6092 family protein n=1 Tax=Streptomyces catenulae TaxID=66875 RepID=A0ABV2Z455_9ACTN|nr:DUF6092 family protein [Streptomyces catenulae]
MSTGTPRTPDDPGGEELALLAAYLLSSARRLLQEPPSYALYRLMDGARRVLALYADGGGDRPELVAVHAGLDDLLHQAPNENRDYAALLDGMCRQMVAGLQLPAPEPAASAPPS